MKKHFYTIIFLTSLTFAVNAQTIGINTDGSNPDANSILHLNNDAASSLDSTLIRVENEKAANGTGIQIHNSGQSGTTAQWDIIVPGGSTDLRVKNSSNDYLTIQNDGDVGIGTTAPLSSFDIQGSLGYAISTITSATTLNNTHNVVLCNTGAYTVTLPDATLNTGKSYYIKNIDTDGDDITIDGNGAQTIDGSATYVLSNYQQTVRLISDGSNWFILHVAFN